MKPTKERLAQAICIFVVLILTTSSSGCIDIGKIAKIFEKETPISRTEWAFEVTQINQLNKLGLYGANITVGVVDTGIDLSHPDFKHFIVGRNLIWLDLIGGKSQPYDDNGHGTNVAGILAAKGKIQGIAPDIILIVVKAIGSDGSGKDSDVSQGINFCVQHETDVIVLSLGGQSKLLNIGDQTASASNSAVNNGIFVVAAAGNDGGSGDDGDVASPATIDGVIAVGAIDQNKNLADFSSKGDNKDTLYRRMSANEKHKYPNEKPELVAPGVDILSTYTDERYAMMSGTSQATPFVGGAIALLLEAYPQYRYKNSQGYDTVEYIKTILADTGEKNPRQAQPHDDYYGYGLVKGYDAYLKLNTQ